MGVRFGSELPGRPKRSPGVSFKTLPHPQPSAWIQEEDREVSLTGHLWVTFNVTSTLRVVPKWLSCILGENTKFQTAQDEIPG